MKKDLSDQACKSILRVVQRRALICRCRTLRCPGQVTLISAFINIF